MEFIIITTSGLFISIAGAYLVSKFIPDSFVQWASEKLF